MIDGAIVGAALFGGGIACGLLIALYFYMQRDARDTGWAQIVQQQQAQIDDLLEYIADHSDGDEVSAEELGYE